MSRKNQAPQSWQLVKNGKGVWVEREREKKKEELRRQREQGMQGKKR